MPRKRDREHPDDIGVSLEPAVTPQELQELHKLGYRGPTPSTQWQAAEILRDWRGSAAAPTDPER